MVLTVRRSAWWPRHFLVADIPVASMTVIDGGVNRNAASSRAPLAFRALAPTARDIALSLAPKTIAGFGILARETSEAAMILEPRSMGSADQRLTRP
jgi:hypothetical protein